MSTSTLSTPASKTVTGDCIPNTEHNINYTSMDPSSTSIHPTSISSSTCPPANIVITGPEGERAQLPDDSTVSLPDLSIGASTSMLDSHDETLLPATATSGLPDSNSDNHVPEVPSVIIAACTSPAMMPTHVLAETEGQTDGPSKPPSTDSTTATTPPAFEAKAASVSGEQVAVEDAKDMDELELFTSDETVLHEEVPDFTTGATTDLGLASKAASGSTIPAGWILSSDGVLELDDEYELADEDGEVAEEATVEEMVTVGEEVAVEDGKQTDESTCDGEDDAFFYEEDEPVTDASDVDDDDVSTADVEDQICLKSICTEHLVHPAANCKFGYKCLSATEVQTRRRQREAFLKSSTVDDMALFPTTVLCWGCGEPGHKLDDCVGPSPPPLSLAPGEKTHDSEATVLATSSSGPRRKKNKAKGSDISYIEKKRRALAYDPPTFPSPATPYHNTGPSTSAPVVPNPTPTFRLL